MNRSKLKLAILGLGLATPSWAKDDVNWEGRLRTGFQVDGTETGKSLIDAKLKVKSKRHEGTRAVIEMQAKADEKETQLQEAYIDHKTATEMRLQMGLDRKRLGLEYERNDEERVYYERSLIYTKLEDSGYAGRELILRLGRDLDNEQNLRAFSIAIGYAESSDTNLHFFWHLPFSTLHFGAWGILQTDRMGEERELTGALLLSLWNDPQEHNFVVELASGLDPHETELQKIYGDSKPIYFYGLKTGYTWQYALSESSKVEPYMMLTLFYHDHTVKNYSSQQGIFGCNYHLSKKFMVGLSLDITGTNSRIEPGKRNYDNSKFAAEGTYYF